MFLLSNSTCAALRAAFFLALYGLAALWVPSAAANTTSLPTVYAVPHATVTLPEGAWQQSQGPKVALTPSSQMQSAQFIAPATDAILVFSAGEQRIKVVIERCHDAIGGIFKDCLDPTWQKAFTARADTQWQIIPQGRQGNHVLDITFGGPEKQRFGISAGANSNPNTPNSWLDLSAFNSGHLHFDIRALNFADNINGLEVTLSCGGDCRSKAVGVNLSQLGQWQRISIPVKTLMDEGLDISQVYTGFEIQPVEDEQRGVRIQLDNIHLEATIPKPMDWVLL